MINLVNKENIFNDSYLDSISMIEYENYKEDTLFVEYNTFIHFEQLAAHLKVDDIIIDIKDAYRSLERQESIFCEYMNKYGLDYTEEIISMPGYSEHHTGEAIDFALYVDGKWIDSKDEIIKYDDILDRIYKSLKYFGFILRYPDGKENITGYQYNPYHIRYIGYDEAMQIQDKVLEEYLDGEK